jgi:AraC-like DNA-binding protein
LLIVSPPKDTSDASLYPERQDVTTVILRPGREQNPAALSVVEARIVHDPAADHSLEALSERAGFSVRRLTRDFQHALGVTPGRCIEGVRGEAAKARLQRSDEPLATIARATGFGSKGNDARRVLARAFNDTRSLPRGIPRHGRRSRRPSTPSASSRVDPRPRGTTSRSAGPDCCSLSNPAISGARLDQAAQPRAAIAVAGAAHHRHNLLDPGRISRVSPTLVAGRATSLVSRQRRRGAARHGRAVMDSSLRLPRRYA